MQNNIKKIFLRKYYELFNKIRIVFFFKQQNNNSIKINKFYDTLNKCHSTFIYLN